ncbi:MAG: ice-binding family protein [Armatimonadetes bacterium]|nr:ice-binding family protein [Armatimonadota bacterium]
MGNASKASTSTDNTVTYDVTRPTISIGAPSALQTRNGPITYTITYGGANTVTLLAGNVTLNKTGTANGTLAVSGSGTATRTVRISSITGNGTLGISIAPSTASDTTGNLALAAGPSTRFTVDNTRPTISIGAPSALQTRSGPITYTITYGGANTVTLVAGNVTLNKTGTANGTVAVSGSGTATRTVRISSITGNGTLGISIAANTASDAAGNLALAAGPSATFIVGNNYTLTVIAENGDVMKSLNQPTYNYGTVIGLTAAAAAGYHFVGWSGDLSGTMNPTTITMDEDKTVTANFAPGPAPGDLGSAASFGAFGGGAGITNEGILTVIDGDIGTTAASTLVVAFFDSTGDEYGAPDGEVTGRIYTDAPPPAHPGGTPVGGTLATMAIAQAAFDDSLEAWNDLAGLAPTGPDPSASGELSGLVLAPGVYKAAGDTFNIEAGGTLTLDALGDPNAVWVFQMGASLTVGDTSDPLIAEVIFKDGIGNPNNVYWQVGSAATINAGANMVGTIIASAGVEISTSGEVRITTLEGRALGLYASVTMVNTVINVPLP